MKDYIVKPETTLAELSVLGYLGITPFQEGYCRVRMPEDAVIDSVNIIPAPEGLYELPSGEMLGVFA